MKTIACSAPYGSGGLGRHFAEVVEEARQEGILAGYYSSGIKANDDHTGHIVPDEISPILFRYTPIRFSPGWKGHLSGDIFDRHVAAHLRNPIQAYAGFGGQSQYAFQAARRFGATMLELHAATSHGPSGSATIQKRIKAISIRGKLAERSAMSKNGN